MEMLIFLTGVCEHIHLALVAETTSGIKQEHVLIQKSKLKYLNCSMHDSRTHCLRCQCDACPGCSDFH